MLALLQFYAPFKVGFLITYIGPIIIVLALSLLKEIWDEIKKKIKDKKINEEKYEKIYINKT